MKLLIINFSHPLTLGHRQQIIEYVQDDFRTKQGENNLLLGTDNRYEYVVDSAEVIDVPFQLDPQKPLYDQVRRIYTEVENKLFTDHNEAVDGIFNLDPNYNSFVNEWGTITRYTADNCKYVEPLILVNLPSMSMASAMMYQICKASDSFIHHTIFGFIRMKVKPDSVVTLYELAEIVNF